VAALESKEANATAKTEIAQLLAKARTRFEDRRYRPTHAKAKALAVEVGKLEAKGPKREGVNQRYSFQTDKDVAW
jgi:hypothetical protein